MGCCYDIIPPLGGQGGKIQEENKLFKGAKYRKRISPLEDLGGVKSRMRNLLKYDQRCV
jgi:hypothetical protein